MKVEMRMVDKMVRIFQVLTLENQLLSSDWVVLHTNRGNDDIN